MPSKPGDSSASTMSASPLTWAAMFGLITTAAACSSVGQCKTDELPPTDPCYQKACCDSVILDADGGVTDAGGPGTTTRVCGACNG